VVISGPSGAGKSTVVKGLRARHSFRFSVSVTTRRPRPNEADGVHYHFVDRHRFEAMVRRDELLEWARYADRLYGTPRGPVMEWLAAGDDVLLDIEIQGARQVRNAMPEALLIFVVPPSIEELERRLRTRRDTPDVEARLAIARREIDEAPALFDHIVINDQVEAAVAEILGLLTGRDLTGRDLTGRDGDSPGSNYHEPP
jgi:guanylate kinase